ncbi:unnamed protein product [Fusarium graminearum]|nr:unnamed protein product [Fusarium graminearum]
MPRALPPSFALPPSADLPAHRTSSSRSASTSRSTLLVPLNSGRRSPSTVSPPALSPPVPTPTGSGASTGSTGLTCLLWRSAPSTLTRTSVPRTTSGVTETRLYSWNDEVNYHNKDKTS